MALIRSLVILEAVSVAFAQNPINVASADFLGFRRASNDQSVRDLGYSSEIGGIHILTFGDGVGCTNAQSGDNCNCALITARDGAAIAGDDPLTYTGINTQDDLSNSTPQMASFCPILDGEDGSSGLGLTNIISVNDTTGVLLTRPTNSSDNQQSPGAGLAVVDVSSGSPVCTRPFGINSWSADEPNWGQLSQVMGQDGYIYAFANSPDHNVVLARVEPDNAFDVNSWTYYQGNGQFTSNRISMSSLTSSSPQLIGNFTAGQGSVWWSAYYQRYILFDTSPDTWLFGRTAPDPWGPWDEDTVNVYTAQNVQSLIYSPSWQTKYTDPNGKYVVLVYTDSNTQGMVNVTFA